MKYIVILMLLFMNHCNDFAPLLDNKILILIVKKIEDDQYLCPWTVTISINCTKKSAKINGSLLYSGINMINSTVYNKLHFLITAMTSEHLTHNLPQGCK